MTRWPVSTTTTPTPPPTSTMAAPSAELQAKLQELDHELEEGDITRKGSVALPAAAAAARAPVR